MIFILGRQYPLHHELVGAPEVEPDQRCPDQSAQPRYAGIVVWPHQRQLGRVDRAHHMVPATSFVERKPRSEEHTSELQSLMRISYAVFCLKKKTKELEKTNCK